MIADIEKGHINLVITKDDYRTEIQKAPKNAGFVVSVLFFDPKQGDSRVASTANPYNAPALQGGMTLSSKRLTGTADFVKFYPTPLSTPGRQHLSPQQNGEEGIRIKGSAEAAFL